MTYRELTIDDVKILSELFSEFPDGWNQKMLCESFNKNTIFAYGAFDDEKLVGAITFSNGIFDIDLQDIFVLKEYRNRGIATNLIAVMQNYAKASGKGKIFLEVRKSNAVALSLYEKAGFNRISERKKYYGDEDAIIYCKEIL